ncbi:hypothetical protein HY468_04385, partial [Candidatus Roizmanbacteria bacterium]|nr:hypothetical protein [Candidatus Roizmanbacteria bacterium]
MRKNISTYTPSEKRVGYSRAVVINNHMYITGTTAVDERGNIRGKTLAEQTEFIFNKIKTVLELGSFSLSDVVIVRAYVPSMKNLFEFDTVFHRYFKTINPCCTLIGINTLFKSDLLIEIECMAEKE